MEFEEILKRVISLILIVYVTFVALNPSVANPDWILLVHENPWVLLVMVLCSYYVMQWDFKIGLLILICAIAVYLDIILIIKKERTNNNGAIIFNVDSSNTHREQVLES